MASEFGVTAWGRAWLRTVEKTTASGPNPALPVARSLARNGAVTFTQIAPGEVTSEVSAKGKAFTVTVSMPLWTTAEVDKASEILRSTENAHRTVSTGELSDDLLADFQRNNIAITVDIDGCVTTCDCTGRRRPCVHHLATVYALAGRIDEEPVLAVTLRSPADATAQQTRTSGSSGWIRLSDIDATTFYG